MGIIIGSLLKEESLRPLLVSFVKFSLVSDIFRITIQDHSCKRNVFYPSIFTKKKLKASLQIIMT